MEARFYDLIAKALSGEASPAEQAELDAAVQAGGETAAAFEAATMVWSSAETIFPKQRFDTSAAWSSVAARLAPAVAEDPAPAPRRVRTIPVWPRWAAAAAAVLALGVFLFRGSNSGLEEVTATRTQLLALADGSRVTLHKGATLRYPKSFTGKADRHIYLEGRAFFEVSRNPAQPFVVEGKAVDVTVLGTSFEVDDAGSRVAVKTGKVQVAEHDRAGNAVVILPGEQAVLQGDQLTKESANANDLYWQTSQLEFNNQSFDKVVAEISRILEVPVRLDESLPASVQAQSVTFTSRSTSVEPVLDDLCRITGSRWERDGAGYRIFSRAR